MNVPVAASTPSSSGIELVDHFGHAASAQVFLGGYSLVLFGFTHCSVVCPRALARYAVVLGQLAAEGWPIRGFYISVDPERDTPEIMRDFLQPWPGFLGLTGSAAQVDQAKAAFRVFARRDTDPDTPGGYRMPHTAVAYLLTPQGRYLAHFPDALTEGEVIARLRSLLATRGTTDESASSTTLAVPPE